MISFVTRRIGSEWSVRLVGVGSERRGLSASLTGRLIGAYRCENNPLA
jgi:hypothetical protein